MIYPVRMMWCVCDRCGKQIESNGADMKIAEDMLRREGWLVVENWTGNRHYCEKCKGKINTEV